MEHSRGDVPSCRECGWRKEEVTSQELTCGLGPRGGERGLKLRHLGSFHADVRLSPLAVGVAATEPVVSQPEASGVSHGTVNHHCPYVRPVVGLVERVPAERSQVFQLDTRSAEPAGPRLAEVLRAEGIQQKQHPHTGPCALGQNRGERVCDPTRLRVVELCGNRASSRS